MRSAGRSPTKTGRLAALPMLALAASCTAILGIDKDYHEPFAGTAGGGAGGSSASTSGSLGAVSGSSSSGAGGSDGGGVDAVSCLALHQANPAAPSGVYTLDPDGPGPSPPFQAYCEMVGDGGGWTLVLKMDGTKDTFAWASQLWMDNTVYAPDRPDLDTSEAKLASFSTVPLGEVRLGMIDAGVTRWLTISVGKVGTLSDLITGGKFTPTSIGRATWQKLVASPSLQLSCNAEGFNVGDSAYAAARIGILANEQNDCTSPDSFIGFGAQDGHGGGSTGNFASFQPENGDRTTRTFGYVMVR